uniref:RabGAP/TBC domain-containing protein, putative n=1 Tax=Babesia bovis TaxID=5865 RepID=S6C920_BABBO|nr:RabGAP/TBC domain-containing protein, putative [Babesia bovis]
MDDQSGEGTQHKFVDRLRSGLFTLSKRMIQRNLSRIQSNNPAESVTPRQTYDNYGFSLNDNVFARGIIAYEDEFNEKRERRLKRWENMKSKNEWTTSTNPFALKVLIRKGIPDEYRAKMWFQLSGADQLGAQISDLYPRLVSQPLAPEIAQQIEMDIYRTFPTHRNYKRHSAGTQSLKNVLTFCQFCSFGWLHSEFQFPCCDIPWNHGRGVGILDIGTND